METNDGLVDKLVERGHIESEKIEEAFRNVDRADFVPEKYRDNAYTDTPLPITGGATISAPHMVAMNTELLNVKEEDRVIEIGSGSGYQLAILSHLTDGEVIGVEIIEELVRKSRESYQEEKMSAY
ncbi:MAG: protein-L-isoaspartate O-methyltransferase [Candidatus Nanohaloarchaea archaeon]